MRTRRDCGSKNYHFVNFKIGVHYPNPLYSELSDADCELRITFGVRLFR